MACYTQSIMNMLYMSMKDIGDKMQAGIDKQLEKLMKTGCFKSEKSFVGGLTK